jgi:hypothetical protein
MFVAMKTRNAFAQSSRFGLPVMRLRSASISAAVHGRICGTGAGSEGRCSPLPSRIRAHAAAYPAISRA